MTDGIDVDGIAATAETPGLVSPDTQEPDEVVVVIYISGGLRADVGTRGADIPRLRIVVLDDDNYQASGGEEGVWTETPTSLELWDRDADAALARVRGELPDGLRRELGLDEAD